MKYLIFYRFLKKLTIAFPNNRYLLDIKSILKEVGEIEKINENLISEQGLLRDFLSENVDTKKVAFIGGSGKSINSLSEKQREFMESQYVVGINNFGCSQIKSHLYVLETGREDSINFEFYIQGILNCYPKESLMPKILLNYNRLSNKVVTNYMTKRLKGGKIPFYIQTHYTIKTISPYIFKFFVSVLKIKLKNVNFGLHHPNSLIYVYNLLVNLGFKKIVLVGFDMNDCDYFFYHLEDKLSVKVSDYYREKLIPKKKIVLVDDFSIHPTGNKKWTNSYNCMTALETLKILSQFYKKKNNIVTMSGNENTLLGDFLEVYNWNEDIF